MKKTAILIPTFRNTLQNIATLKYLATFSSKNLHIIISDCSLSLEKHASLDAIEKSNPFVTIIYQNKNFPLYTDVVNMLVYSSKYEYVAIAPDDDYASLSYFENAIDVLDANPDCVCSYGNYIICQSNGNAFRDSRQALQETPVERLANGFNPDYFNTMFFAVFRRSAMQPWINFCQNHPLISSFFDFLHCISLLVQGKVVCHTNGIFLWTGENWDTPEENSKTRARYYMQIGLSEEFSLFHDLHFAVEGVNFLLGKHSPSAIHGTQVECAQIVWSTCMKRFRGSAYSNIGLFEQCLQSSPSAVQALNNLLIQENCEERNITAWFAQILSVFSYEKSKEYLIFHNR